MGYKSTFVGTRLAVSAFVNDKQPDMASHVPTYLSKHCGGKFPRVKFANVINLLADAE
jgi:hypothetical protein